MSMRSWLMNEFTHMQTGNPTGILLLPKGKIESNSTKSRIRFSADFISFISLEEGVVEQVCAQQMSTQTE